MEDYRKIYADYYGIKWDTKKYDVHHLDFNRKNNDAENLVLLPNKLHHQFHRSLTIIKSEIKKASDIWNLDFDLFTTKELQAFLSYKIKVIDFIRLRKYAEMDTSGTTKDMDALIKNFLPSMYFEYVLGE